MSPRCGPEASLRGFTETKARDREKGQSSRGGRLRVVVHIQGADVGESGQGAHESQLEGDTADG